MYKNKKREGILLSIPPPRKPTTMVTRLVMEKGIISDVLHRAVVQILIPPFISPAASGILAYWGGREKREILTIDKHRQLPKHKKRNLMARCLASTTGDLTSSIPLIESLHHCIPQRALNVSRSHSLAKLEDALNN